MLLAPSIFLVSCVLAQPVKSLCVCTWAGLTIAEGQTCFGFMDRCLSLYDYSGYVTHPPLCVWCIRGRIWDLVRGRYISASRPLSPPPPPLLKCFSKKSLLALCHLRWTGLEAGLEEPSCRLNFLSQMRKSKPPLDLREHLGIIFIIIGSTGVEGLF